MFMVSAALFFLYVAGLWFFLRGDHALRDRASVNWLLFAGFWILAVWVVVATRNVTGTVSQENPGGTIGLIGALFIVIVGILLAIPFWLHLVHLFTDAGVKSVLVNAANMTVEQTFDQAEKAEHERRYDDAIKLYLVAAAEAPKEPAAWRRAGEAALKKGDRDECLRYLRRGLARTSAPEDIASLAFRIVELLQGDEARRELEQAADRLKGTKFEQYARDRIRGLG